MLRDPRNRNIEGVRVLGIGIVDRRIAAGINMTMGADFAEDRRVSAAESLVAAQLATLFAALTVRGNYYVRS